MAQGFYCLIFTQEQKQIYEISFTKTYSLVSNHEDYI